MFTRDVQLKWWRGVYRVAVKEHGEHWARWYLAKSAVVNDAAAQVLEEVWPPEPWPATVR